MSGQAASLPRALDVERVVVDRAQRVHQRADDVFAAALLDHARAGDVGVGVVHRIGQAEAADAVARQHAEGERHELRARGLPGDEAEAGRHELQRRVRRGRRHQADALPGILLLVAHRHAHVGRGREVDGPEAHAIHDRRDRQASSRCRCRARPTGTGCRRAARCRRGRSQPWAMRSTPPGQRPRKRARNPVSTPPRPNSASARTAAMEIEVGGDAVEARVGERTPHELERGAAIGRAGDDLAEQRIVDTAGPALPDSMCVSTRRPCAGRPVHVADAAGAGEEVARRILGIDAAFDGAAIEANGVLVQPQACARGDRDLLGHEIDAGDGLGHRVLDLDARVHLEEVEGLARGDRRGIRRCRHRDSQGWRRGAAPPRCSSRRSSGVSPGAGASSMSFW